jgi:hypothetical protein
MEQATPRKIKMAKQVARESLCATRRRSVEAQALPSQY